MFNTFLKSATFTSICVMVSIFVSSTSDTIICNTREWIISDRPMLSVRATEALSKTIVFKKARLHNSYVSAFTNMHIGMTVLLHAMLKYNTQMALVLVRKFLSIGCFRGRKSYPMKTRIV